MVPNRSKRFISLYVRLYVHGIVLKLLETFTTLRAVADANIIKSQLALNCFSDKV